jgi:hypothetical protein
MIKLAHIVNPVHVAETSDLSVAQPITFETMRRAQRFAVGEVDVALYAAHYPEDRPVVPHDFQHTQDLERSVLDVGIFRQPRKLPLLQDILARLHAASDADYLIYTNVDIGVQPHFYLGIRDLIEQGYDAFVVNRRTINQTPDQLSDIPLMYESVGKPHPGWDCFIFPRASFPQYDLGNVCIGTQRVGLALLANLLVHAARYREFKQMRLTFHLGDDRNLTSPARADYAEHNTREVIALLHRLEKQYGKFDRRTPPGKFLYRKKYLGPLYEAWVRWSSSMARK